MESASNISNKKWWKESVIYQIYPRSFKDSNGDGVGDINGIIEKLDYLKRLGIDVIWLSPVYESPNDDNGYDISNYQQIMREFGTMADWERMLEEIHKRDMKLLMDLVINHTSDEHEWFQKSRASKENNPYRDYYIWRPPHPITGKEPNNWISFFSGSVWKFDEQTGEYYLHLFSKKQPDLNWENPQVRKELINMICFWLDKGVDGFRLDAINVISKVPELPDAPCVGATDHSQGSQFYFNGPRFIEFLQEINDQAFSKYQIFTVGEMPNVTPQHGETYTHDVNGICSMLFHFEHMDVDSGKGKWDVTPWKLSKIKEIMSKWQTTIERGWNTLYLENHDQPRSISRFGDAEKYRLESGKMLATWLHMMQGTPFIYQGQELGMTNMPFETLEEYKDIESINYFKEELSKENCSVDKIKHSLFCKSRDNARTPMQWTSEENAGFSTSKPWINVNPNYKTVNAESALNDSNSLFYYYQHLIKLRKQHSIVVYGRYKLIAEDHPQIYAYTRKLDNEQLVVIANFTKEEPTFDVKEVEPFKDCELLIANYDSPEILKSFTMRPFEVRVYLVK